MYPELVYRIYHEQELVEEVVQPIVMRCWHADELLDLLESDGFRLLEKWGGFAGEEWGFGNEQVVRFELA